MKARLAIMPVVTFLLFIFFIQLISCELVAVTLPVSPSRYATTHERKHAPTHTYIHTCMYMHIYTCIYMLAMSTQGSLTFYSSWLDNQLYKREDKSMK